MTKEALKLALEALEVANSCVDGYYIPKGKTHLPEIELAITAIKEALANEALDKMAENARELGLDYEPVAWRAWVSKFPQGSGSDWVYVTKPIMKDSIHNQPLYTTPPQRTWVGLTDKETVAIELGLRIPTGYRDAYDLSLRDFAKAIEQALKERNT